RPDALVDAAADDPARLADIRQRVRSASRTSLAYEKLVGPNPRTIILGVSMLAGSPLWYFLAEIVLLNAILLLSVQHHNAMHKRLVAALS
ncbi:MAG TPA: CDP-alcohol phosphatidyltransferase, partial [Croceibacterium sp.]